MGSYVGIDLHRRRSVVVVLDEDGKRVSWSRIDNTPANLAGEIVAAGGRSAEVAMEATWGWYWAADVIAECGATLHLAHPLGIAGYQNRRVNPNAPTPSVRHSGGAAGKDAARTAAARGEVSGDR